MKRFVLACLILVGALGSPAAGAVPAEVVGLKLDTAKVWSLSISWQAPEASVDEPIENYRIAWSTDALHWQSKLISADRPSTTIFDLEGGRTYLVKVSARNSSGAGPDSDTRSFSTLSGKPKFVKPVKANAISAGRVRLYWPAALADGSPIINYEIKWKLAANEKWGAWVNLGTQRFTYVSGWQKFRKYKVMVRATNSHGSAVSAVALIRMTK